MIKQSVELSQKVTPNTINSHYASKIYKSTSQDIAKTKFLADLDKYTVLGTFEEDKYIIRLKICFSQGTEEDFIEKWNYWTDWLRYMNVCFRYYWVFNDELDNREIIIFKPEWMI